MIKVAELIERFEIPEQYHHAMWESYSAGANYGFFKALGKVTEAEEAELGITVRAKASPQGEQAPTPNRLETR